MVMLYDGRAVSNPQRNKVYTDDTNTNTRYFHQVQVSASKKLHPDLIKIDPLLSNDIIPRANKLNQEKGFYASRYQLCTIIFVATPLIRVTSSDRSRYLDKGLWQGQRTKDRLRNWRRTRTPAPKGCFRRLLP